MRLGPVSKTSLTSLRELQNATCARTARASEWCKEEHLEEDRKEEDLEEKDQEEEDQKEEDQKEEDQAAKRDEESVFIARRCHEQEPLILTLVTLVSLRADCVSAAHAGSVCHEGATIFRCEARDEWADVNGTRQGLQPVSGEAA